MYRANLYFSPAGPFSVDGENKPSRGDQEAGGKVQRDKTSKTPVEYPQPTE